MALISKEEKCCTKPSFFISMSYPNMSQPAIVRLAFVKFEHKSFQQGEIKLFHQIVTQAHV